MSERQKLDKGEEFQEKIKYHQAEALRIRGELNNLGPGFARGGVVMTLLRARISQEQDRARKATREYNLCPFEEEL